MAYPCPKCGTPLRRFASATAGALGGVVGALIVAAFGQFKCPTCGPVDKSALSPEVRRKMLLGSITMIVIAVGLVVALIMLLPYIAHNRR